MHQNHLLCEVCISCPALQIFNKQNIKMMSQPTRSKIQEGKQPLQGNLQTLPVVKAKPNYFPILVLVVLLQKTHN